MLSYWGNTLDTYAVVGTKGSVEVNPVYMYGKPLEHVVTIGETRPTRASRTPTTSAASSSTSPTAS